MTFISDAYTKFLVNIQTENNQRPSFKLDATVSGLFQRWFSANVETPRNLKHFFNDVDAKKIRLRVDQIMENQPRVAVTTEILTGCSITLKYLLKPLIRTVQQSFD
jgi:hypothetical protein